MPLTLTVIPKPSAEVNPETSAGRSKNTNKHQKTKRHQSKSSTSPQRRRKDSPRRPSSARNSRQLQSHDDPFSITGFIHEQVNTAVRRIPGIRWLTDTVSHPIIVAREKLDKLDVNMTQRKNNQDGSWLYPKGKREASKKKREIDIDSLKRRHKKQVKKEEKRKARKMSSKKRMAGTEVRETVVLPERNTSGDSVGFCASPDSAERLFTIEDVNAGSGSSRNRYRPKNLVKVTPSFNYRQDASPFWTKLPTRDEFRFTPRLLRYESERQSGTVCNVVSSFDVDDEFDEGSHEGKDYHLLTPEVGREVCERRVEWRDKEMRKASPPRMRGRDTRSHLLDGYPRRNFRQDVNFIGVERVVPFSSSEETISETRFPTRRNLNFVRNNQLTHHVYNSVQPLPEEQVFETSHPIKKSTSGWVQEDTTHNGLNDFSDENFLSMPKYVQVLPSGMGTSSVFSNQAEERSSTRKYPKPRMEDEFEGLFVDRREQFDTNLVPKVANNQEKFQRQFADVPPNYSEETSVGFFNFTEEQSYVSKYPKPRLEDEFEGLFVDRREHVDDERALEMEKEQFLPQYDQVLPNFSIGSSSVFSSLAELQSSAGKCLKPRVQDELKTPCVSKSGGMDATHEVDRFTEFESPADFPVFLLPSSKREGLKREQDSRESKNKCNVFQFSRNSTDQGLSSDEELPLVEPKILNNLSEKVLEVNELRNRTFDIEHEDTDEEVDVHAVWKVSGHSGFEQISGTGENTGILENSGFGANSGLGANPGLGGSSLLDENSDPGENSGLNEYSMSETIDIVENSDTIERNTNQNPVEEIKEDLQEQVEENDKILDAPTSSTSDVDADTASEDNHQELHTSSKFKKNKRYMTEKLNLLHGSIEQLGSGLEELDILHIDQPYDSKYSKHDRDLVNEPPDNKEGCPMIWENSPGIGKIGDLSTFKFGVLPQRKLRNHIRDRMMAPSTVLRMKEQKRRARESSQSHAIGNLANGLFRAIIQNGFGPKLTRSPSGNATSTAASLDSSVRQTASLASSSSKIKKQVSFASQVSSECETYSTDSDSSDYHYPTKTSSRLSQRKNRFTDKLDLAVATVLDLPPTLSGTGNDGDTSVSETELTAKTTSSVLYLKHRETSEETLREKGNSTGLPLSYHNFPPLEDERQSDEAQDTASEFEISTTESESETEDGQNGLKQFQVSNFQDRARSEDGSNTTGHPLGIESQDNSATGLPRTNNSPRWYNRFVLGKRHSRVGPSQDCLPSRKLPTPRQALLDAVHMATML